LSFTSWCGEKTAIPIPPVDILKKRYAKGELSKEEYERLRKDIED